MLVDEPFAGLTASRGGDFSELIREFRAEGRAVLLVDHNVKGVAALVDRVLAMYLGEWIAEGAAADVMRDETVRARLPRRRADRVGASASRASPTTCRLLQVENVGVLYGKALALQDVSLHVHEGEFVSLVGLNGAGKTTLFNAISGLVPYSGAIKWGGAVAARAQRGVDRPRRRRAVPGDARAVRRHERAREPRPRRQRPGPMPSASSACEWLFDLFPILREPPGADGAHAERRRAADARHRPRA